MMRVRPLLSYRRCCKESNVVLIPLRCHLPAQQLLLLPHVCWCVLYYAVCDAKLRSPLFVRRTGTMPPKDVRLNISAVTREKDQ